MAEPVAADSSMVATTGGKAVRSWRPELGRKAGFGLATPLMILLLVFVLYPFVRLGQIAFGTENGFQNAVDFFGNPTNIRVLRTTFLMSFIVTVICVVWGALMAWTLKVTQSKTMRFVTLLAVFAPFWMGTVIKLYAWTVILQTHGLVNNVLVGLGIIEDTGRLSLLYNELAVVIGMVYQMLPFAVLPLLVAFATIDLDLIRAAESLGAARIRAITSVVLPLAAPGMLATFTLVFVICTGFFLTPVVLGGFTAPFSASLIAQNIFVFFDLNGAAMTAVALIAGALIVIGIAFRVVGPERLKRALG